MDFKNKLKNFWRMNAQSAKGFTLVELIVVIAILAILAGIAVPAYSGYVEKANKQADMTLVSDVVNAMTLKYYDEGLEGASAVILTTGGASSESDDSFAAAAMKDAFGENWKTGAVLKHDEWGNGAHTAKEVLARFKAGANDVNNPLGGIYSGEDVPSFANDIDDLFVLIKDTAISVAGKDKSGAELIQGASKLTVQNTQGIDAAEFATYWANNTWDSSFLMGVGNENQYNGDIDRNSALIEEAIANAAVIKARNTAFAIYLRDAGYPEVYDLFANYSYSGGLIPKDTTVEILGESQDPQFGDDVYAAIPDEKKNGFESAVFRYFGTSFDEEGNPIYSVDSQAYKDGLAYFAMMDTVDSLNDESAVSDDIYWNDMAGAVSLYGSIARGEVTLVDLESIYNQLDTEGGNAIVVTIMSSAGKIEINVSPKNAFVKG